MAPNRNFLTKFTFYFYKSHNYKCANFKNINYTLYRLINII